MRNYHLVLEDGTERNIRAEHLRVVDGVLEFKNGTQEQGFELVCAYAAGTWKYVEVERLDDKG